MSIGVAGWLTLDRANVYQHGQSEEWLGEWMASRKNREEMVIATKFTTFHVPEGQNGKIRINYQGNHIKNMKRVVEESLKRLQTSYLDIVSNRDILLYHRHPHLLLSPFTFLALLCSCDVERSPSKKEKKEKKSPTMNAMIYSLLLYT